MFYILGVNHIYQWKYNKEFVSYIKYIINSRSINAIVEEFSEEACVLNKVKTSILKKITSKQSIIHVYLDPNRNERRALGIPSRDEIKKELGYDGMLVYGGSPADVKIDRVQKSYYLIREKEWLRRIHINNIVSINTLVVTGFNHIKSFSKQLQDESIDCQIIICDHFKGVN